MVSTRCDPNHMAKCKFCERVGSMTVLTKEIGKPLTMELSEAGEFAHVMELDCKGLAPVKIEFGRGWKAETIAGAEFGEIDLSTGQFVGYDEMGGCLVAIHNLCGKITMMNLEVQGSYQKKYHASKKGVRSSNK